jgi:hypothetical protein
MNVQAVLLHIGSLVIFLWGVGHLMPTRSVVAGFGDLSPDNTKIITMEWLIEGITLCFLGVLVAATASILGPDQVATHLVARLAAAMLLVLAAVSAFSSSQGLLWLFSPRLWFERQVGRLTGEAFATPGPLQSAPPLTTQQCDRWNPWPFRA